MKAKKLAVYLDDIRASLESLSLTLERFQLHMDDLDGVHNDFCQITDAIQEDINNLQSQVDKELDENGNKRF